MMHGSWQITEDENSWEKFLLSHERASFLQSSAFGQFHQKLGHKVWFFIEKEAEEVSGVCLVVELATKLGKFFYIPGGPILSDWGKSFPSLLETIKTLGKEEKVSFVRFDPRKVGESEKKLLESLGLKKSPSFTQPQASLLLDLTQSEEEIRAHFSSSTRYNVGWVARQGVTVRVSQNLEDIEVFLELLKETSRRQGFVLTDLDYYRQQFLSFAREGLAKLYLTKASQSMGSKVLAASIVIYYGNTATYLHAASSNEFPKLRAPYLQQWQIIEDAKKAGKEIYDFWGVAKDDNPKDPWRGVTDFKESFGGEKIYYEIPYDLILSSFYPLQKSLEKVRKIVRKFKK